MVDTTRFPGGANNRESTHPWGDVNFFDPSVWMTYWNDFFTFAPADFVITETDAAATETLTGTPAGGNLLITNTAADNDLVAMQLVGTAPLLLALDKRAFFRVKFRVSDATETGIMFGLTPVDTTPFDLAVAEAVTAGIYFFKADGGVTVVGSVENANTPTSTSAVGTLVAATNTEWAWYYNGADVSGTREVTFWIDNVKVATITTLTNFPTVALNLQMAIHNGEAVAKTMTIDHVLVAIER